MGITTQINASQQTHSTPIADKRPQSPPRYNVVLIDDADHTYDYVIEMLRKLWGMPVEQAFGYASQVDTTGRVIVDTTTFERAELKRDQIHTFGRDWRVPRCQGSMSAAIEPSPS